MAKDKNAFSIRFWGVRGSIPTPTPTTTRYGGNTACLEVRCGNELIILDAGSGIRALGQHLCKHQKAKIKATLLFSHLHWDHVQGFPFFAPAYMPGNVLTMMCEKRKKHSLKKILQQQMTYPFFPVDMGMMQARLQFREFKNGASFKIGRVLIETINLRHPQGCSGYRITFAGKSFLYATDTEHLNSGRIDESLVNAARDCQFLIYDTTYTNAEYYGQGQPHAAKIGWGHSTWEEGIRICEAAKTPGHLPKLVLFHHDPTRTDKNLDQILRQAKNKYTQTLAAKEGMILQL